MSRYQIPDELPFNIPKQPVFIDDIVLDEELQLIREEFFEEMAPIDAAWAAYEPRRTYGQLLPMALYNPPDFAELTFLQIQFLKHLVWSGEISPPVADGLACHRTGFVTALELFEERWKGLPIAKAIEIANMQWELRAVA